MTSPAPLRHPADELPDIFTTAEAYAAGLTKRDLSRDGYRRLFRGVYVNIGADPTYAEQLAFALRTVPSATFVAEHSAARQLGGVTPPASDLHLGTRVRTKSQHDGISLRFYTNPPDLVVLNGIRTTSAGQTYLDMARSLEFMDLLVLGDSLVRRSGCSPTYLKNFVADSSAHGAQRAREVAQLVRTDVESPNESRLRLLIVSGGLAEPKVNEVVRDPKSRRKRKLDLCYPDLKVAIEFDGRHHVERSEQWNNDILRREVLEEMGWRFVIVTSSAMYADPRRVLQRITDKVVVAGGPRMPISDGWKRHFG
ncbi:endonuclease domain-containing protein [Flexivirga oryzae]|uniref:Very-short-patch-repair endonuclease n=1 Tax=Flexivirga oryzae TaxID=1794944 RepID=A0A839N8T8_9MICO|nr:DUF559 domain-containing protein [Flexivirga oryzae]MBB2892563.1 very-short-patch-repair endonuclease [Flexivirga oryzae]